MPEHVISLAYCTNIWTHHQAPICIELVKLLGVEHFKMCLFEPVHEERRQLGWASDVPDYNWIAGPPRSSSDMERLAQIVCDADVAVLGACPIEIQAVRVSTGKLTFIMSERMMRKRFFHLRMINPRFARGIRRLRLIANRPNVHYLAIGEYALSDAKLLRVFDDRIWKWAYFISQPDRLFYERYSSSVRLLWAGRFLDLKRVDVILRAMKLLEYTKVSYSLDLIGNGQMRNNIELLVKRLELDNRVRFYDSMPYEAVRERMTESDIYILPSNHLEGWGAVVGEAMSEGCVVVASRSAGASNVLIEHGRTGFLFDDGDVRGLADILSMLIINSKIRREVGQAATDYMRQLWHPRIGAERLIELFHGLLGLTPIPEYSDGPCCRCLPNR